MKISIIGFVILFITCSCSEKSKSENDKLENYKLNSNVQKLVDSLAVIEYVGYDEKNNKRYQELIKNSTLEDLIFLTNYKIPEIRCYAFDALENRNYPKIKKIFYEHQNDTALVESRMYDMILHESVASFMLQQIHPAGSKNSYRLSRKEFDENFKKIQNLENNLKPKLEPNWNDSIKKWQHLDLSYYQEYYWADSGDKDFEEKRKLVNKPIDFIRFDEDNILATAYFEINCCNSHFPNIERRGDTIILKDQLFKKGHCDDKMKCIEKINFYINDQYIREAKFVIKK